VEYWTVDGHAVTLAVASVIDRFELDSANEASLIRGSFDGARAKCSSLPGWAMNNEAEGDHIMVKPYGGRTKSAFPTSPISSFISCRLAPRTLKATTGQSVAMRGSNRLSPSSVRWTESSPGTHQKNIPFLPNATTSTLRTLSITLA
jgi:hypothetical protein